MESVKRGGNISTALCVSALVFLLPAVCGAMVDPETAAELKLLREQNALLKGQVEKQNTVIESLSEKVDGLTRAEEKRAEKDDNGASANAGALTPLANDLHNVHISGEGAVAFFHSDKNGSFPNSEFRVDEAKLFVEAPIWQDVYFYSELNLALHENDTLNPELGELYLDFEDVSKLWGQERQLNIRAGRIDIPFGEEYIYRDAIDNPFISHSLSDIWGVDAGVELYGSFGKFSYTVAVQNGGLDPAHDFNADKSVVARVSYDPTRWLHLSVSGMRTGDLDANMDYLSAVWFGNGWFRSLGSTNTTTFNANMVEGDVIIKLPRGRIHAFGGYIVYDDNDPMANNRRDAFYYSVEGVLNVTKKFYVGGRFSQIISCKGLPIPANGDYDNYFNSELTRDIWRLSLGTGYQFSRHLVVKAEYTLEEGRTVDGDNRCDNQFAAEAAFGF